MAVDVLSEVLSTLELTSNLYFRAELSRPFSIAVPEHAGVIRFHVATEGPCTIGLPGRTPVAFGPGDLVMVPHGSPHVLSDVPGRPSRPLEAVLAQSGFDGAGHLTCGGGGRRTVLVCGHFGFEESALHPFVASLPPLLLVRSDAALGYDWIEAVLRHLEGEVRARRSGYREIVRRLSEVLLIEVLRAHADRDAAALSALADPQLGRALQAMHAEPAADWSLEELARIAGQSRTIFAERFRERMGISPMKYLASWRMQKARRLLSGPGCSVAEAAQRVGYSSDSAFNRTFRKEFGESPGALRRARARS